MDRMEFYFEEGKGMLVISRKEGESVVVPSIGLTIHVIQSTGGKVKIGIEAPREVKVLRGELQPPSFCTPPELCTPPGLCTPPDHSSAHVAESTQNYSIST